MVKEELFFYEFSIFSEDKNKNKIVMMVLKSFPVSHDKIKINYRHLHKYRDYKNPLKMIIKIPKIHTEKKEDGNYYSPFYYIMDKNLKQLGIKFNLEAKWKYERKGGIKDFFKSLFS